MMLSQLPLSTLMSQASPERSGKVSALASSRSTMIVPAFKPPPDAPPFHLVLFENVRAPCLMGESPFFHSILKPRRSALFLMTTSSIQLPPLPATWPKNVSVPLSARNLLGPTAFHSLRMTSP